MTPQLIEELNWDWNFWARPKQLPPSGDWATWIIRAGRGFGKMIANDTPIATPGGWTTMGRIAIGDTVFDEGGRFCAVTAKFSPIVSEQYRLKFSDGSTIDTCGDHQWVTWTHAERKAFLRSPYEDTSRFPPDWPKWRLSRKCGRWLPRDGVNVALVLFSQGVSVRGIARATGFSRHALSKHLRAGVFVDLRELVVHEDSPGPQIRTTREIVDSLSVGKRRDTNHCVPNCAPLDLPDADLPVPPYTLGVWLGDGSKSDGTITSHQADAPFIRSTIEYDGFQTRSRKHPQNFCIVGLFGKLRRSALMGNKHVPPAYLRASIGQRLALLRGLMDTDGNIEQTSTCAFVNTNKALIDAVEELIHSLGMKTRVWSGVGACNGKKGKQFWRVQFTPIINPFTLPRKANRIRIGGNQSLRNHHRMIVAATRINSVPMSCITVNSPNGMYLAGRQMIPTHNTRSGSGWVHARAMASANRWIAMIARTPADARDYMIEGPGGILRNTHPRERPNYEPSKRRLTWPNGSWATIYSDEEPDQLRGFSGDTAWLDEFAKFKNAQEGWDNLQFGMRETSSDRPRRLITTTPKPIPALRAIMKLASTRVVIGSSHENAKNLDPTWYSETLAAYEGTRIGRQEIYAEMLDDVPGALWTHDVIEKCRCSLADISEGQRRAVVVAVDPSGAKSENDFGHDEIGIIIAARGQNGHGYILADRSLLAGPRGWANVAVTAFHEFKADRIVAEQNFGGAMVEETIKAHDRNVPVRLVVASRGKAVRAEPISVHYEQGVAHHAGRFPVLEDQLCAFSGAGYVGNDSPDHADAAIWAFTDLFAKQPLFVSDAALASSRQTVRQLART
jgi:phage terminase large subunit-like protein